MFIYKIIFLYLRGSLDQSKVQARETEPETAQNHIRARCSSFLEVMQAQHDSGHNPWWMCWNALMCEEGTSHATSATADAFQEKL